MIGFFTDPYPDELLYSSCARYHRKARNVSRESTVRDLFGNHQTHVAIDFPARIGYLAAQLPVETYSLDQLLGDNTMLPLYSPFMSPERHRQIREGMRGNGGSGVHARLGLLTSNHAVQHLRFCIVCVEDDRKLYRETYWHRTHQIPGIEVCPTHAVFLSDSKVPIRHRDKRHFFVTAKQAVNELSSLSTSARFLDLSDPEHKQLLMLARDAFSLLAMPIRISNWAVLHRRYLRLLFERSLATYQGAVRHAALATQFQNYYSSELLQRLGCELIGSHHWLHRILTDWKRSHSPRQHLLLMQFLECRPERFFRLRVQIEPYGKGPWPCLNAASDHYRECRINECQIAHTQDHTKRPLGTFSCDCGFSYRRTGADTADDQRYKYDRIMTFGDVWYDKLRAMVDIGDRSPSQMSQELGVPISTITIEIARIKKAREANAPMNQRFTGIREKAPELSESDLRDRHRKRWMEVAAENPQAGRSALSLIARKSYYWLVENDRQWLDDNYPRQRPPGPGIRTDWVKRDAGFAVAVREAAANIQGRPGRPVFASRTAISRIAGVLTQTFKNRARLPLTHIALDEVAETKISYAIRRICWATKCFEEEQIHARKSQLVTRAGVSSAMAKYPEVESAVNECVQKLAELNVLGWPSTRRSEDHGGLEEATAA
jgi:hypothetical protein